MMIKAEAVYKSFIVEVNPARELKERVIALVRGQRNERREIKALSDVSLSVQAGEALALIGGNGAGKSTLLRCLAGILTPTAGTIELGGRPAALLAVGAGFHPELTGRENIYLNASLHGVNRATTTRRFDEVVSFAELGRFIDVPLKVYSAGMTLRLGFAIAVHLDPEIILVDEALTVGDLDFQKRCLLRMQQLRDEGVSFVLATHDLETARNFCSSALLLDDGRCVLEGSPGQVCDAYEQRYTGRSARLVGGLVSQRSFEQSCDPITPSRSSAADLVDGVTIRDPGSAKALGLPLTAVTHF